MNRQQVGAIACPPPLDSPVRIYGVVLGIGVLCSLAIVTAYEVTRPIIRQNKIEQRRQAIMEVIPAADLVATFQYEIDEQRFRLTEETEGENLVFAGFSSSGELVGVAVAASGMGYQDSIQLLYGYDLHLEAIVGIRILESRETPGLGDRIESDAAFRKNFEQLDVRVVPAADKLVHPIEFVKPGDKSMPWQIDGITGATISSRAVAQMIHHSAADWIPRIRKRQSDFAMSFSGRNSDESHER
jgi:electron transport complex protein RnfG